MIVPSHTLPLAAMTSVILFIAGSMQAAERKPNVVVIISDDQGWGDLSLHGNTNLKTPNIDSLARDGAQFSHFFVCPVCSPTRAEFFTGRYHPRGGVFSTSTGGERLDLDESTIGDTFKAAGYVTGAFGKWHNGMQYPYHPNARGFDEYYGFCSGHWGNYFNPVLEHNGKLVRGKGFIVDDFTNHAIRFIKENKDKPFFCYLPLCTPHSPMQVPDRFFDKFKGAAIGKWNRDPKREKLPMTRAALAMCENIDWNVGRILKKLNDLKLADDTIVIYLSDNGPNSFRWNGDMKGRKGSTDEGGVRVPCLIRWPGQIRPGTRVEEIAGAIDLLPTLADMTGIERVGQKQLDGVSVKPLLLGTAKNWPDRMIFSHWAGRVSVRTQQFRLDNKGALYDMTVDPGQRTNIAQKEREIADRLAQAAQKWRQELLPGLRKQRPFPVGYREFPITHLPARDGIGHGNIRRSARAPNCSFLTNWVSKQDSITWDIEVATEGKYEAVVYYTCPKQDVGSEIELQFQESRVKATVSHAHDPPLLGAENDRSNRGSESFVKDFKPMRLGVLSLEKGRGALTLKATKIAGRKVMDVRYVVLTLLK